MILAHIPSGYLLGHALSRGAARAKWLRAAMMLGAVLPDLDMIWFYVIDDRAFHHHRYWVHIPMFWLAVGMISMPLIAWLWRPALLPAAGFLAGVFLHLVLDTIAGDILWAWPWSDRFFHLITVQPTQSHWVLSFLLHPVALIEIAIIAAAAILWGKTQKA